MGRNNGRDKIKEKKKKDAYPGSTDIIRFRVFQHLAPRRAQPVKLLQQEPHGLKPLPRGDGRPRAVEEGLVVVFLVLALAIIPRRARGRGAAGHALEDDGPVKVDQGSKVQLGLVGLYVGVAGLEGAVLDEHGRGGEDGAVVEAKGGEEVGGVAAGEGAVAGDLAVVVVAEVQVEGAALEVELDLDELGDLEAIFADGGFLRGVAAGDGGVELGEGVEEDAGDGVVGRDELVPCEVEKGHGDHHVGRRGERRRGLREVRSGRGVSKEKKKGARTPRVPRLPRDPVRRTRAVVERRTTKGGG